MVAESPAYEQLFNIGLFSGSFRVESQMFIKEDIICQQFIAHNTSTKLADLELLLDFRLGARWNGEVRTGIVSGKSAGYSLSLLSGSETEELVQMSIQVFQEGKMEDLEPEFVRKFEEPHGAKESGTAPQLTPHLLLSIDAGSIKELTVEYKLQQVITELKPELNTETKTSTITDSLTKPVEPDSSRSTDSNSNRPMTSDSSDHNVVSTAEIDKSLEKKCKTMLADEGEITYV